MKEQGLSISAVVPVYNSESTLHELTERLTLALAPVAERLEILLINDCSRDRSWDVIRELASSDSRIIGLNLMRNYGQHNALLAGIRAASHEIIVTLDDDLQHPPEEIPGMLEKLVAGYDVVYGSPLQQQHGFWRDLPSRVTKLVLQGAMGVENAKNVSAFRVFRTQLREAFTDFRGAFISIEVLLTWGTTKFTSITVRHDQRLKGRSNYTFWRLITHALNMVTGYSILPLQVASVAGFGFALFGMAILAYVIGRYLMLGGSVPGFPFLASIIAIFSGVQLLALGIIGEYLARIHSRVLDRPPYIVRDRTSPAEQMHAKAIS